MSNSAEASALYVAPLTARRSVRSVGRSLVRRKMLLATGGFLLASAVASVFAGVITAHDPSSLVGTPFAPYSGTHFLGTDQFGRDVFSRIVFGARVSIGVGLSSIVLSLAIGLIIGVTSGYLGGKVDLILQRIVDVFIVLPALILALVLVARLGPGVTNTILAIAVIQGPRISRVIRASVLSLTQQPYIEAARSIGASDLRVMVRHLSPNTLPVALTLVTSLMGQAIIIEASLSFLGLGVQPPTPSWGQMLSTATQQNFLTHPWLAVAPGVAITLTVLAANLFGDAMREALDPRLRGSQ